MALNLILSIKHKIWTDQGALCCIVSVGLVCSETAQYFAILKPKNRKTVRGWVFHSVYIDRSTENQLQRRCWTTWAAFKGGSADLCQFGFVFPCVQLPSVHVPIRRALSYTH
jgi:hypothetical protein